MREGVVENGQGEKWLKKLENLGREGNVEKSYRKERLLTENRIARTELPFWS